MLQLIALRSGDVDMDLGRISGDSPGPVKSCPIMAFLVITETEVMLFDTGMNPAVRDDAVGHWGRVANRVLVPTLEEGQDVPALVKAAGLDPADVTLIANSHLHNDHSGTNWAFPQARVLVRPAEWDHAVGLMDEPNSGYVRSDFYDEARPPQFIEYDDEYDVLGDGRVVLISTIGHTPGHQSLKVTFRSGEVFVLTGDAVYSEADLASAAAPAIAWRPELAEASARRLGDLRQDGATVLVCHELDTWHDFLPVSTIREED